MIYDTYTLKNWKQPDMPTPERLDCVSYNFENREEEYLRLRRLFEQEPA